MDQTDRYMRFAREAVDKQDVDAIVRIIEDGVFPFWLRRDGEELAMKSADDEFAVTVFNRLFLPITKTLEGDTALLLEWWLRCEDVAATPRRLDYLRRFFYEAAGFADLSDPLYDAILGAFSAWTQQPKSLSGWSQVNEVTRRFLATYGETISSRLVDPRLLRAALWSGDLGLMREFVRLAVGIAESDEQRLMLHFIIGNLLNFSDRTALRPYAEAVHAKDPRLPLAIHNLAQVYDAECRDAAEIAKLYACIDEQLDPVQFRMTVNWIAQHCHERGYKEEAANLFALLPTAPAEGLRDISLGQKVLQDLGGGAETPVVHDDLLGLENLPPVLGQPVAQAGRLAQGDMTWGAALTAQALEREFRGIVDRITAIPQTAPYLAECEDIAQRLKTLSRHYFEISLHFFGNTPIPLASKYGRVDMERLRATYVGLSSVVAAAASIGLESILGHTPIQHMERCLHLLGYYTDACIASGAIDEALALLERFERFEPCRNLARRLIEKCLLEKGEVSAAMALLTPDELQRSCTYAVVDRNDWSEAEGATWEPLADDPQCQGEFEVAWADGSVIAYDHLVPAVRLAQCRPDILFIRRGEVIRGQKNLILRPDRLHYAFGYPDRTPDILACGERAVRLMRLESCDQIAEPVLVLENFDALYHRNFYHWTVLLLTRINYAKQSGILEGRRLIIPEGLSGWMLDSLSAIGVNTDDLIIARADVELRLTDALLLSSVEFASPTLLQLLCDTILPPAAVDDESGASLHLYLSRRNQTRRPFLNADEIEAIAGDLGFTIVQPEILPFVEQARLFRRAVGVAGPEGAAYTNTIFCKPGARILGLNHENDLFPTFNDIAAIKGLKHRKLTGKAELDDYGVNYLWGPYRIDPTLAERDLRWALGG